MKDALDPVSIRANAATEDPSGPVTSILHVIYTRFLPRVDAVLEYTDTS